MSQRSRSEWLLTTINAVREVMTRKLARRSLDAETEREMQMALNMIETIWEELCGQTGQLSLEQRRYDELFEHSPDAYAVTDAGGNVREANRSLAEALGAVRTDLLGQPLLRWVPDEERTVFLEQFIGLVDGRLGGTRSWRSRLRPASGPERDVLVSIRGIPLNRSGSAGICWLFRFE